MMPNSAFYANQAEDTAKLAAAASLPSVRANLLEVAHAWHVLAERTADIELSRTVRASRDPDGL